jgi:NAD(P)-dependent dehydrogenase (short-subunit alcohol dehydrogenase family)
LQTLRLSRLFSGHTEPAVVTRPPASGRSARCDVCAGTEVHTLIAGIGARGGGWLDALICNAGIVIRKPIAALALSDWSAVMATKTQELVIILGRVLHRPGR